MSFDTLGLEAIPAITVICFLIGEIVKLLPLDEKWIPVVCGFTGGVLGVVAMWVMPGYPADNPITAVAVGIVSGLAATGVHQIYKQLTKTDEK